VITDQLGIEECVLAEPDFFSTNIITKTRAQYIILTYTLDREIRCIYINDILERNSVVIIQLECNIRQCTGKYLS
jgi:hypothetical protein